MTSFYTRFQRSAASPTPSREVQRPAPAGATSSSAPLDGSYDKWPGTGGAADKASGTLGQREIQPPIHPVGPLQRTCEAAILPLRLAQLSAPQRAAFYGDRELLKAYLGQAPSYAIVRQWGGLAPEQQLVTLHALAQRPQTVPPIAPDEYLWRVMAAPPGTPGAYAEIEAKLGPLETRAWRALAALSPERRAELVEHVALLRRLPHVIGTASNAATVLGLASLPTAEARALVHLCEAVSDLNDEQVNRAFRPQAFDALVYKCSALQRTQHVACRHQQLACGLHWAHAPKQAYAYVLRLIGLPEQRLGLMQLREALLNSRLYPQDFVARVAATPDADIGHLMARLHIFVACTKRLPPATRADLHLADFDAVPTAELQAFYGAWAWAKADLVRLWARSNGDVRRAGVATLAALQRAQASRGRPILSATLSQLVYLLCPHRRPTEQPRLQAALWTLSILDPQQIEFVISHPGDEAAWHGPQVDAATFAQWMTLDAASRADIDAVLAMVNKTGSPADLAAVMQLAGLTVAQRAQLRQLIATILPSGEPKGTSISTQERWRILWALLQTPAPQRADLVAQYCHIWDALPRGMARAAAFEVMAQVAPFRRAITAQTARQIRLQAVARLGTSDDEFAQKFAELAQRGVWETTLRAMRRLRLLEHPPVRYTFTDIARLATMAQEVPFSDDVAAALWQMCQQIPRRDIYAAIALVLVEPPAEHLALLRQGALLGAGRQTLYTLQLLQRFHPAQRAALADMLAALLRDGVLRKRQELLGLLTDLEPGYCIYLVQMLFSIFDGVPMTGQARLNVCLGLIGLPQALARGLLDHVNATTTAAQRRIRPNFGAHLWQLIENYRRQDVDYEPPARILDDEDLIAIEARAALGAGGPPGQDVHSQHRDPRVRAAYQSLIGDHSPPSESQILVCIAQLKQEACASVGADVRARFEQAFNAEQMLSDADKQHYQVRYEAPEINWPMRALVAWMWQRIAAYTAAGMGAEQTTLHQAQMRTALVHEVARCWDSNGKLICAAGQAQHLLLALQGYFAEVKVDLALPDMPAAIDYVPNCARTLNNKRADGSRIHADFGAWATDTYRRAAAHYPDDQLQHIVEEMERFAELMGEVWAVAPT